MQQHRPSRWPLHYFYELPPKRQNEWPAVRLKCLPRIDTWPSREAFEWVSSPGTCVKVLLVLHEGCVCVVKLVIVKSAMVVVQSPLVCDTLYMGPTLFKEPTERQTGPRFRWFGLIEIRQLDIGQFCL